MNSAPQNDTPDTSVPAGFAPTALAVALTVADVPASLAWYRDVLGFTVERTFDRAGTMFAASIRAGAAAFLLSQDNGALGADRAKGAGISLNLTTPQDIDTIANGIKSRGGVLEADPVDGPGGRVFRLRDPDGFRLVISSERK